MKKLRSVLIKAGIILLFALLQVASSQAQFREGAIGFSAGLAMPSGVQLSAAVPQSYTFQANTIFTYYFGSNINFVISRNFQVEAGLGYVKVDYTVPTGQSTPSSQNTLAISLGGKYFFPTKSDAVMPYLGFGFSYVSLPGTHPVNTSDDTKTTSSLLSVNGAFGAMGFLNTAKTVALFVQMGIGFNKGSSTYSYQGSSLSSSQTNINLGGSALGFAVYF